jgi:hypothetical protein
VSAPPGRDALLQRLLDEREIYRVLTDYCRGVDRLDEELLRSVYHPDAYDNHGDTFRGSSDEFVPMMVERLANVSRTMHVIGNVTIDIDGCFAWVESYFLAYHREDPDNPKALMNPAGTDLFAGGRYVDKFEKRAGEWKILRRDVLREFTRIDPIGEQLPLASSGPHSSRTRDDPSYSRDS